MSDEAETPWRRLQLAVDARKLEIGLFWQRSLFFWGFISAAFVALVATVGDHPRLALLISCFGLVCSVCWSLVNRGSKYWHEAWEQKVHREQKAIGEPLFSKIEPIQKKGPWLSARRYSVSKLVVLLSDFVCLVWLGVLGFLVATVIKWEALASLWCEIGTLAFVVVTFAFIWAAFSYARSTPGDDREANS